MLTENCGYCGGLYNAHKSYCKEKDVDASQYHKSKARIKELEKFHRTLEKQVLVGEVTRLSRAIEIFGLGQ